MTIIISALLILHSALHGQDDSTKEIQDLLTQYYQVMSDRDWVHYKAFFIEGATLTTIWQAPESNSPAMSHFSIDEFIHQTKDGPDSQPIFEEKMTGSEIDVRGQLASAWIRYKAKFGSESHLMEWSGTDLFTLIKDNSSWKIVSLAYIADH